MLAELFAGLKADRSARIVIEGHTSSEGTDDYNRQLSERRASAVVAALVQGGSPPAASAAEASGRRARSPATPMKADAR